MCNLSRSASILGCDCTANRAFPFQMAVRGFLAMSGADTGWFGHTRVIRSGWMISLL